MKTTPLESFYLFLLQIIFNLLLKWWIEFFIDLFVNIKNIEFKK